ncbi:uncharacterized protein N7469_001638 [Penicillium citrinum]|uniref:Uncharacterized protein n=2 Tax=Penicillium TaxID=5073 RepID=A0A9W9TVX3_PENCI|nr:uncharacterized protein N7469_001638 [Penicillium citrinum]KAJ5243311.1 hypothetical protein N7469_001638 [Penicillium citrinum]KAJ5599186.1 hypothetical protein N7450_000253 [Penicillium hetheringtonii]
MYTMLRATLLYGGAQAPRLSQAGFDITAVSEYKHLNALSTASSYVPLGYSTLKDRAENWAKLQLDQMWIEDVLDRNRRQREGPQIHLEQDENSPYANVLLYRSMAYQCSPYSVLSTEYCSSTEDVPTNVSYGNK